MYLELENPNGTRGHTFKIKNSYSRALAPACGAHVFINVLIETVTWPKFGANFTG